VVSLRLTLLGGFEARDGAGRQIDIAGSKAQAILACLALRPGEPQSREKLMALLWSERGESQARGSLRHAIWTVRRALQDLEPFPLVIEGETLALDAAAVEADVVTLQRSAMEGSADALRTAVALYRGDFLHGIRVRDSAFEEFLRLEREHIQEIAIDVCGRLMNHQLRHESVESAAQTAKRLLEIDPLQEPARRTLMRYFAAKGQVSLALNQYRICRETLGRELQVEPDVDTERLFNEIRLSRPCVAADVDAPKQPASPLESLSAAQQDKPSIAVLPFLNLSGDPEQEYFSDGVTEDIITALSRLRWFLVISRNSTFVYKGRAVGTKEIGRELGVRYLLEGSVRRSGNRLRITAQLIDAATGTHHWGQNYDRELTDIFELQDDITQSVTAAIEPKLIAAEGVRSERRSPEHLDAWDVVMRALVHYGRMTTRESETAIEMLREAVRKYPDYGPAHSLLAFALLVSDHVGWGADSDYLNDATQLARRAAELDDQDPWAHLALGYLAFVGRQTGETVRHYMRALDLNPNFATAYGYMGWALTFDGQSDEAIRYFEQALRMSPHDPLKAFFYSGTGVAHYCARRYDDAVDWASKAIMERPGFTAAHRIHCASLAQAGRCDETREAMTALRRLQPDISIAWIEQHVPYTKRAMPHFLEGMRKAGLQ
jgi:TolB-like protein/Tfp pilus assembly protein PilF